MLLHPETRTDRPNRRPYTVVARFDECRELRAAIGELGFHIDTHSMHAHPSEAALEVEVEEPEEADAAVSVLNHHCCDLEVLDFAGRRIA